MFGFSKKRHGKSQSPEFVYDQAVIVDILFGGLEQFGTEEDRKAVESLEREVTKLLPPKTGVDGHDIGDGEATIYIYGPSADKTFASIEEALKKYHFTRVDITLQYGLPDDPNTKERKFSLSR